MAASDALAATNSSTACFVSTACAVSKLTVPRPSVCVASNTRKVPGSCTVHEKRTPRLRGTPLGTRDVAEREALVGGAHLARHLTTGRARVESRGGRGAGAEHERRARDEHCARSEQREPGARRRRQPSPLYSSAVTSEGQSVVPQPVPAAPPTAGDVLRHGASVGFGALGLARRAVGTALARVQPAERRPPPPSTLDLVPGAMAGLALVAERRVRSVVVGVAAGTATTARAVTRRRRATRVAAARGSAVELERDRAPRAGPQPGRGLGRRAVAGADDSRERDRAARPGAPRQSDSDRRGGRAGRHRSHRAEHRPRRRHPRVDCRRQRGRRSTRCARRESPSTCSPPSSSTGCSSAASPADLEVGYGA